MRNVAAALSGLGYGPLAVINLAPLVVGARALVAGAGLDEWDPASIDVEGRRVAFARGWS